MVRATMTQPISWLRHLIFDPIGVDQFFDDQTLQDHLDHHAYVVRYMPLRPEPFYTPGGTSEYHDYYADESNWEADEVLYDGSYNALTPVSADRLIGHWVFADNQPPPVLIVGKFYDVFGAAADVLEAWAAREKLSFDFNTDDQSFRRSQKAASLLALAREYRRLQRPVSAVMARTDANS